MAREHLIFWPKLKLGDETCINSWSSESQWLKNFLGGCVLSKITAVWRITKTVCFPFLPIARVVVNIIFGWSQISLASQLDPASLGKGQLGPCWTPLHFGGEARTTCSSAAPGQADSLQTPLMGVSMKYQTGLPFVRVQCLRKASEVAPYQVLHDSGEVFRPL